MSKNPIYRIEVTSNGRMVGDQRVRALRALLDEHFKGWGAEDCEFYEWRPQVRLVGPLYRICVHQPHERI